jgi:23S rRNA (guanosine2251-2'-O)-methyltransferase
MSGDRAGRGGRTKKGKPRPGSGGQGKRKLEGKGPTPPAHMRPGHPAQRRAAGTGRAARREGGGTERDEESYGAAGAGAGRPGGRGAGKWATGRGDGQPAPGRSRGAGDAPEVVAGRNAVLEALRARVPASALFAGPRWDADERVREAISLAAGLGIPLIEAGRAELDRLTGGSVHQGLALRIRPYDYLHPADLTARAAARGQPPLIVALDGITDPRNLGAIIRSAAAFGGHGVVVPTRRSAQVTAGAWKASAGALAVVPVAQAPNLARTLAGYAGDGLFVVGLDAAGETGVGDLEVADGPLVLVVGSEGRGLSRLVADRCDLLARIEMTTGTSSLNAGVAAGIALHEVAARRRAGSPRTAPA